MKPLVRDLTYNGNWKKLYICIQKGIIFMTKRPLSRENVYRLSPHLSRDLEEAV